MNVYNFNFKVIHSTKSTLYGYNVSEVWRREEVQRVNLQTTYPDYKWPKLAQSLYRDHEDLINKPVAIQDMKWSHDGTSIITISNDTGIRQYLIPEENTDDSIGNENRPDPSLLTPFTRGFKNKSIVCSEIHPLNSMYDRDYNFVLLGSRDMPIQMYDLNIQEEEEEYENITLLSKRHSNVRYSYNIVNPMNEKFESPFSIKIYPHQYDRFYTGGVNNIIKIYDFNRSLPICEYSVSRRNSNRSIISCFEEGSNNYMIDNKVVLWASYKNEFGRLDTRCAKGYSKNTYEAKYRLLQNLGNGIYQMIRSDNGHYLYIFLRKSDKIQIFDMRNMGSKPINELKLPFKIGYQKILASMVEGQGLMLGSSQNTLLVWDKALIESGGITNREQVKDNYGFHAISIDNLYSSTNGARINIITQSPNRINSDNGCIAISSSFDRNCTIDATATTRLQSSLYVLGLN